MAKVKLDGYRCDRCGHEWLPREKGQDPLVCPKCKSRYWNRPRKDKRPQPSTALPVRKENGNLR